MSIIVLSFVEWSKRVSLCMSGCNDKNEPEEKKKTQLYHSLLVLSSSCRIHSAIGYILNSFEA